MKKKDIVLVMIEPPLPFGNAAARWYYVLVTGLVARGYKLRTFVAYSKEEEVEKSKKIFPKEKFDIKYFPIRQKSSWRNKIASFFRPYSFKISPEMKRELDLELKKGFDLLHIEQLWGAWAALEYKAKSIISIHYFQHIDLEFTHSSSLYKRYQKWQIFKAEKKLTRNFKSIKVCSDRLRAMAQKINKNATVMTNPLGIDYTLYDFIKDEDRGSEATIVLIGTMSWYPTSSAAIRLLDNIWPEVKKEIPNAKLKIIGYEARQVLRKYKKYDGVEILENVPDIGPYFKDGAVFVYAPKRGSGMKIKILEAMLFGIPVVTTSEGAEGLALVDGEHAGLCEDDEGLIKRTVELLKSVKKQNIQRKKARELIEATCGPTVTLDKMEEIYRQL